MPPPNRRERILFAIFGGATESTTHYRAAKPMLSLAIVWLLCAFKFLEMAQRTSLID